MNLTVCAANGRSIAKDLPRRLLQALLVKACISCGAILEALQVRKVPAGKALNVVRDRLLDFRKDLPTTSATAKLIDAGAPLDEISEISEEEGLFSLITMLVEVEQEGNR